MKLKSAYADMGIPFSSGLAYDLGSIPFQEAAQNAQIAQNTQGNQNQQFAQLGNALGGLNLGGQNPSTNTSTTNTDLTNPNLTGTV
ncbi:MAG: hypothetical protein J2P48_10970 [Alphaproteobacteria bacterium]|nr:hypothetical protein [Alphaproteobacteria bacterium]